MKKEITKGQIFTYDDLVEQISKNYTEAQVKAVNAVNTSLLEAYWETGRHIIEYEQKGSEKAEYGRKLLENLSKDLSLMHGKGFSVSNLQRMRLLYTSYPIHATLSHELSWSHYVELLKIDDPLERNFYEKQAILENWSRLELIRQKKASLFLRLAASRDKDGIIKLSQKGQIVQQPIDLFREPYILDFLKIPEPHHLSEADLETRLLDNLQSFLLELGKGFAFVGRQYRITLGNRHHRVDLVFYHRILKCFVLIDLKHKEAGYEDIGQMNMYLGYFEAEENTAGDNPPIGIILAREKDELLIEYAVHGMSAQLFVQKYQLYLPNEAELRREIEKVYEQNPNER
jgi:predicted nuclease of restriction endonuclease-like (RecB) superfamily